MSAEEFWKDDPQLFVSYRTSFVNKKKREVEEMDYKSWLNGLYIHDGNSKLLASLRQFLTNILSKTKDRNKIDSYPKKPYSQSEKEHSEKENKKIKNQGYKNFESSLSHFGTMKQRYLENLKNKKGE